jgi:hypothetical protein
MADDVVKLPEGWNERVGAFAKAVGKEMDLINYALSSVIGPPSIEALAILADEESTPFEDIKDALALQKIPSGVLKKNIGLLRGPKPKTPAVPTPSTTVSLDVLPSLPDDESFIKALKTGGELKVGKTEIICAMRAAIANKLGLFELPDILKEKMEEFAETSEMPCGTDFFTLRNLVTKRDYADVLSVMGVEGSFVTKTRKANFLAKLDDSLWTTLNDFYKQLSAWQQAWMQGSNNPAALNTALTAIVAAFSGGGATALPPGLMAQPDASPVRDAAETVINAINKVFAGIGIPIARAMAYEAHNIKTVLENTALPASLGAANREQMLKMLKVDISSDYVRLESNITRFMLSVIELPKITAGPQEGVYLGAMLQLGLSIQWDKLTDSTPIKKSGPKQF